MLNIVKQTQLGRSIIPENCMTLSFTVSDKMEKQFFQFLNSYLITENDFSKSFDVTLDISSVYNKY
jgi:hypothetical protein